MFVSHVNADRMGEHDLKIYMETCNEGNAHGCMTVFFMYKNGTHIKKNYNEGLKYYNKALKLRNGRCSNSDASECVNLGKMYKYKDAPNVDYELSKSYFEKAKMIFRKGCNDGDSKSCNNLGRMYSSEYNSHDGSTDNFKAVKLYKISCDRNNASGCFSLAYMYDKGNGVRQNNKTAIRLYNKYAKIKSKSCIGGDYEDCISLGRTFERGQSVKKDLIKAKEYFGIACDNGVESGCVNYARLNSVKK